MQTASLCSSQGHRPLATSLSPHRVPPQSWPWPRGRLSAHSVPKALLFHLQPALTGDATSRWNLVCGTVVLSLCYGRLANGMVIFFMDPAALLALGAGN